MYAICKAKLVQTDLFTRPLDTGHTIWEIDGGVALLIGNEWQTRTVMVLFTAPFARCFH